MSNTIDPENDKERLALAEHDAKNMSSKYASDFSCCNWDAVVSAVSE